MRPDGATGLRGRWPSFSDYAKVVPVKVAAAFRSESILDCKLRTFNSSARFCDSAYAMRRKLQRGLCLLYGRPLA